MEKLERAALLAEVVEAVGRFQRATDLVDEAAAKYLGVNRTDLRCLGLLYARGPMHAGRLGTAMGLSSGATTTAIDRLERAGYVRRLRVAEDRRVVKVELTSERGARVAEIYGPLVSEGAVELARYNDADLRLLRDFLAEGYRLQAGHAERIRALPDVSGGGTGG